MANYYVHDCTLSTIVQYDMSFPNLERSLSLLNPWAINLDSDANSVIDSLTGSQISFLLEELFYKELNMTTTAMHRRQLDLAEGIINDA
jgi:hypothetical protein